MNKFTDGPWSLEAYEGDPRYAEHYVKAGDHMVAIVSAANHGEWRESDDEGESEFIANAKLIAASPLMLEALQNLENDNGQIPDNAWKLVQDAIAKATTIQ